MRLLTIGVLTLLFTACSMYQSEFDCPAGKGVGCKSVSQVMDMIIEREEKVDLFVPNEDDAKVLRARRK